MMTERAEKPPSEFDFRRADHGREGDASLLWKLRRPIVPVAKEAIRRFGAATSERRALPHYLLIGSKRGGSTTLARNLVASPGVQGMFPRREALKGAYYFDVNYGRGEDWYRSHFPTRRSLGGDLVGDASPYYLSHPHAAERARALLPDARVVCVLRNPVERAFSHYRERVKQGIETLPTFEDALAAEPERIAGEVDRMLDDPTYVSWNHLNFAYVDQSRYARSLARWLDHWPREQVLILRSEDLYADPSATLARTRDFLGCSDAKEIVINDDQHQNRLPKASLAAATRQRLWGELAAEVEQLAALLDESVWWSSDEPPRGTQTSQTGSAEDE